MQRRLDLEQAPEARERAARPPERLRPPTSQAAVLALQASAGNQAVSRWLAGRTLQRSSIAPMEGAPEVPDITDQNAQENEDAAAVESRVLTGLQHILQAQAWLLMQQQAKTQTQTSSSGGNMSDEETEQESPIGSPSDVAMLPDKHPQSGDFEDDSEGDTTETEEFAELSEVDEEEMLQMPRSRLLRAKASGDITGGQAGAPGQMLGLPGAQPQAVKGVSQVRKNPNKAAGIRYGPYTNLQGAVNAKYDLGDMQTARKAKLVHSGLGNGTPVQTRPVGWWTFLSLQYPSKRRWVQGHFINRRLGGEGQHRNLAPFTYSLNSEHYWSVEKHIVASVGSSDISYTVQAIDGAQGSANEATALEDHQALLDFSLLRTLGAFELAGLIHTLDAASLLAANPLLDTTPTPATQAMGGGATWGQVKQRAVAYIKDYVAAAFPLGIVCRARYYANGVKTAGQVVIDNSP